MNMVILIGRLTSDPELKFFSSGTAVAKCTIAIDRSYKKDNQVVTDFIPIEIWGKQAEYAATCLQKGYLIAISGSMHVDRYVDAAGSNKTFTKVVAKTISKLNVPKSSLEESANTGSESGKNNQASTDNNSNKDNNSSKDNNLNTASKQENLSNSVIANFVEQVCDDEQLPFWILRDGNQFTFWILRAVAVVSGFVIMNLILH